MTKKRSTPFALSLFVFITSTTLITLPLVAQAKIDPSLPNEPLYHKRVLLIFPGFETVHNPDIPVPPLRPRQKFEMAYLKTVDPSFEAQSVIFAGMTQTGWYGPNYGPGWGPYSQRVGYFAAGLASNNLFTDGILPVMFHQDPRYFRKGRGSIVSRAWWAMRSEGVCLNDQGHESANVSKLLGYGMSTALANSYSPGDVNTFGGTMERVGVKIGVTFIANLVREFGPTTSKTEIAKPIP